MRSLRKTAELMKDKLFTGTAEKSEGGDLVRELRRTREQLDEAYDRFNMESDEVMLDSVIYEIQSLRARYRFLIRLAKKSGALCEKIAVFD